MKISLFLFLVLSAVCRSEELYFTQSGSGSHNGTIGNPWSVVEASTAANWGAGAGKISPGDNLHVVGTITGQFTFQASGTLGNVITLIFDTGAKFSSPCWTTGGGITLSNLSYITIDGGGGVGMGGIGGNASLSNGIVENTANGTGLANSQESCGLYLQEAKSVTVKNLIVSNIYVRTGTTDRVDGGRGIRFADANGNGMNNITVTNCIIHDAMNGLGYDYGPGDHDYAFYGNTIYNVNFGSGGGGRGGSSTLTNISFYSNLVYNFTNWNETVHNDFHHNAFFCFADGASESATNVFVYNNYIGPGFGNEYQTSGIYINAHIANAQVFNNVFQCAPGEYTANGLITLSTMLPTTLLVASNTFIGGGGGTAIQLAGSGNGSAVTMIVKNNVGSGLGSGTWIALYSNPNVTFQTNNNLGYNYSSSLGYIYSPDNTGAFKTFTEWKGLGFDTTPGVNTDPQLSGSYHLTSGSTYCIGYGADLSAYFTTDAAGLTRSVPWDIGAYKYNAAGTLNATTVNITTLHVQ